MDVSRIMREKLIAELRARWGIAESGAQFIEAPYRVCPLGAHIDHQLGTVTAMTISRSLIFAYSPFESPVVRLASLNFSGVVEFSLRAVPGPVAGDWGNYPRGAAHALQQQFGPLNRGLVGLVAGDLAEMGVSSSAALGLACLLALARANNIAPTLETLIRMDQCIENQYLGLRNGILDQSAILLGRKDHLSVIDCRAFALGHPPGRDGLPPGMERVSLPASHPAVCILVAFSGLTRALVGSDYNRRVDECAEAARILLAAAGRPDAPARLSEVTEAEYEAFRDRLTGAPARRAAHYFEETQRVRDGLLAWREGDLQRFGARVRESGLSSLRNYECGSAPLADLQELLNTAPGIWGARFSGAGFRGSCVAFAPPEALHSAIPRVRDAYAARHPEAARRAAFLLCETGDGLR